MKNIYSVSQVNRYIKSLISEDYFLSRIYVRGEVSNCKYHSSGHIYFTLKDREGAIPCVMFAGSRNGLKFRLTEGQQVIVLGNISVYERDGRYQLYAREIVMEGRGLLYQQYEALKKELESKGYFAPERKKSIPLFPERIGIVTAPTGAAIQDMCHISARRNPYVQLILYPAIVQGDEKKVAEAIYRCKTPVISAVGHETDVTISDFAADLRAPTPSAAAELAVPEWTEICRRISDGQRRLEMKMDAQLSRYRSMAEQYRLRLKQVSPAARISEYRQRLMDAEETVTLLVTDKVKDGRHRLALYSEKLSGLSPLRQLERGYAILSDDDGKDIHSAGSVSEGQKMKVRMADGWLKAEVREVHLKGAGEHGKR